MSKSRLVLEIDTNLPVGTLRDILNDTSSRPHEMEQKLINFLHGSLAGTNSVTLRSGVVDSGLSNATTASQTATFSGAATAADTVTINGVVFTAVSNVSTPSNNQWRVGTSASTAAANLAAAINASTSNDTCGTVYATSSGAVVTVFAKFPGVIGDSITISKSSTAITLGGATLVNGSGKLPVLATFSF